MNDQNDQSANQTQLMSETEFTKKRPYSPPSIHLLGSQTIEGKTFFDPLEIHQVTSVNKGLS